MSTKEMIKMKKQEAIEDISNRKNKVIKCCAITTSANSSLFILMLITHSIMDTSKFMAISSLISIFICTVICAVLLIKAIKDKKKEIKEAEEMFTVIAPNQYIK